MAAQLSQMWYENFLLVRSLLGDYQMGNPILEIYRCSQVLYFQSITEAKDPNLRIQRKNSYIRSQRTRFHQLNGWFVCFNLLQFLSLKRLSSLIKLTYGLCQICCYFANFHSLESRNYLRQNPSWQGQRECTLLLCHRMTQFHHLRRRLHTECFVSNLGLILHRCLLTTNRHILLLGISYRNWENIRRRNSL